MYENEFIFIKQTIARLFNLLSINDKKRFLVEYDIKLNSSIFCAIELKHIEDFETSEFIKHCEILMSKFIEKSDSANFLQMVFIFFIWFG